MLDNLIISFNRKYLNRILLLLSLFLVFSCDQSQNKEQSLFIQYLQQNILEKNQPLSKWTTEQSKIYSNYATDYNILFNYSQQINQIARNELLTILNSLQSIHYPKDYVNILPKLYSTLNTLSNVEQQITTDKIQTDAAYNALNQTSELTMTYAKVYSQVVNQPTQQLLNLLPQLTNLVQDTIQTGEFLTNNQDQVIYTDVGVEFKKTEIAAQYKEQVKNLQNQKPILDQLQQFVAKNTIEPSFDYGD